jgi:hypothetical protein
MDIRRQKRKDLVVGDRGNIRIEKDGNALYFYSHWGGYYLPQTLANALDRGRDRWDDPSYLTRIIFSEMIKESVEDTTGYGISFTRDDWEYEDLIVKLDTGMVVDRSGTERSYEEFVQEYKDAPF